MSKNNQVPSSFPDDKGTKTHTLNPTFDENIFIEALEKDVEILNDKAAEASNRHGVFIKETANVWMEKAKLRKAPKMLFDELWHEFEVCCLFASSNVGKSILAMVIANMITTGTSIKGFKYTAIAQMAVYLDFELSAKQFEGRYSQDYQNHYRFSDLLYRVELVIDQMPDGKSFEEALVESIEALLVSTGCKVLIIDNLTYLRNETEKSKEAATLMKFLIALKRKYSLSILVLAHTPKRDFSRPLTLNDLSGSSMLGNFFDSAFTIGASHRDKSLRYIKQIKCRETEKRYDSENVLVCQIVKYTNFVEFEFLEYGYEQEHLKELTEKDRDSKVADVKELHSKGLSQREISKQLGIAVGTVNKYIKK